MDISVCECILHQSYVKRSLIKQLKLSFLILKNAQIYETHLIKYGDKKNNIIVVQKKSVKFDILNAQQRNNKICKFKTQIRGTYTIVSRRDIDNLYVLKHL